MIKVSNSQSHQIRWIDVLRVIAITGVVLCHACEIMYNEQDLASVESKSFVFVCHVFGRLGVPLFMMITGYLLLDREYEVTDIKKFWLNKWLMLLSVTGIWFVVYELFLCLIIKEDFTPVPIIQELTLTRKINISHTWYFGMILGIYLLIPFVAVAVKKFDIKSFVFPFAIFFVYAFGPSTINGLLAAYKPEYRMENRFDLAFSGGVWGLYLITGYLLKKGIFKKFSRASLMTFFTASIIMMFLYMFIPSLDGSIDSTYIWYDNVFVYAGSVLFFELISRFDFHNGLFYKAIRFISKYSFPVYLSHNLVIIVLHPFVEGIQIAKSIKVFLLLLAGIVVGLFVSKILAMIPKAGRYITYVKE